MRRFRARRRMLGIGLGLAVTAALPALGQSAVVPQPVVVSDTLAAIDPLPGESSPKFGTAPGDLTAEPSIAVDPTNWQHAITVFKIGLGQATGYATTNDAGRNWHVGWLPRTYRRDGYPKSFFGTTDPVVAFGPDGTAYATFIAFTEPHAGYGTNLEVVSLPKGASHWQGPFGVIREPAVGPPYSYPDKDWLAVDGGHGPGHHPGRLYTVWSQEPLAPMATFSDDGGRHWQPVPSPILSTRPVRPGAPATPPTHGTDFQAVVLKDGSLGVFYDTGDYRALDPKLSMVPEEYRFVRAPAPRRGGSLRFGQPVTVAPARHDNQPDLASVFDVSAAAVDPTTGRIYAAWPDNRATGGLNDIVLSRSDDNGAMWSRPIRVNVARRGEDFHPALAVGPTGLVDVGWRTRDGTLNKIGNTVDTYVRSTRNDMAFGPEVRVNKVVTDLGFAEPITNKSVFLGDYDQLAAAGPVSYLVRAEAYCPAAPGSCTGPHQRIWVAVIGH